MIRNSCEHRVELSLLKETTKQFIENLRKKEISAAVQQSGMDTPQNPSTESPPNGSIGNSNKNMPPKASLEELPDDEDTILPFKMDYLTPRMKYELKTVLKETEESKAKGLKALRELIAKEENLLSRTDENFLLQFLRARKYDVKRAFKLLQNYYSFRKEFEGIYRAEENTASDTRELILKSYMGFLTSRSRHGSVVFIAKIGMWNPEEDSFEDLFRAITACVCHAIEIPATQVCGFTAIFDVRHLTWKQMKYCTPYNMYLIIRSTQYCFPGRYKDFHILSENKLFNLAWSITYPFLTSKLKKRVHFHGKDLSALQKFIHPSVLPVEFGGQHEPFDNRCWEKILYEEENRLLGMLKYGYK